MTYLFSDFLSDFIGAITHVLKNEDYLIKGGQAILFHMENVSGIDDARFSRDIDISFSSDNFPMDLELFIGNFVKQYNGNSTQFIIDKNDIIIKKLPDNENLYFGLRLILNVHEKKGDGTPGKKIFFKDLDGLAVLIDFNCGEIVESNFVELPGHKIRIAAIPLIIAEKFRALCSQIENSIPAYKPTPRPKDFFDIFLIINRFYKKNMTDDDIQNIKKATVQCFNKKSIDLKLLTQLYDEKVKRFHETMFNDQVISTLPLTSKYKDVTFDQVYSESLELLDKII